MTVSFAPVLGNMIIEDAKFLLKPLASVGIGLVFIGCALLREGLQPLENFYTTT